MPTRLLTRLLTVVCLVALPALPIGAAEPETPAATPQRPLPEPPRPLQKGTPASVADVVSAAPGNDAFGSAEVLAGIPSEADGTNGGATVEAGEPRPCGEMGATVWYRVTSDRSVALAADTFGSDYDTVLAVYRGDSLATLELIGCDDDSGWGLQSKVAFQAQPGSYYLQVGGYNGDTGDFSLALTPTGGIAGTVTGEGELGGVCVDVYDTEGMFLEELYVEPGSYAIEGLFAGEYLLHFIDCGDGLHIDEWYADAPDRAAARPVTVQAEQVTSGIDAVLALGGTISGTVESDEGHELYACVEAYDAAGEFAGWGFGAPGEDYSVGGLRTGSYQVRVTECFSEGLHAGEWYDDAATRAEADPVAVVVGQETAGIDASLPLGGYITGVVTGPAGGPRRHVCVDAYDAAGDHVGYGYTRKDGTYAIDQLRAGLHTVRFQNCGSGNLATEWYENQPNAATALPVAVAAGQTTGGIDASLEQAGAIRGRITDAAGRPIRHVCVDAYGVDDSFAGWDYTNANGGYRVNGFQSGSYRLEFIDCEGGYRSGGAFRSEFYDDRTALAASDPVDVVLGQITDGIDAELLRGGTLLLETGGSTAVSESGGQDTYSVQLGAPPLNDVTVSLEADDEVEVTPEVLAFTPGDWDVAQTVTISAVDDADEEGPHLGTVDHELTSADLAFDGASETLYVEVEDDDLVPDAVSLVYDGDVSVARGTEGTFSATLTEAGTGNPIEDRYVRFELGDKVVQRRTDEGGHVEVRGEVDLPYGSYTLRVSSPGDIWYEPAELSVGLQVIWAHTFADGDRAVRVNPATDELQFVAPGDTTGIKHGLATSTTTLPSGHRLTRFVYNDGDLNVDLEYQPETGNFVAVVKTAANAYVLRGTA